MSIITLKKLSKIWRFLTIFHIKCLIGIKNYMKYNRQNAIWYANQYALGKNPDFYYFGGIGGDCTNFVSQCLYVGGFDMVYHDFEGWFYVNPNFRSASWSGVEFFRNYLLNFEKAPNGEIVGRDEIQEGDIIFLNNGKRYYHSLFISKIEDDEIYVCAHSNPAKNRKLTEYKFYKCEFIHIKE